MRRIYFIRAIGKPSASTSWPVYDIIYAHSYAEEALSDELTHRLAAASTADEQADITAEIEMKIEHLFAGTRSLIPNPHMLHWEAKLRIADSRKEWLSWDNAQGPHLNELPSGIASAPLLCYDLRDGTTHQLRLVAGLFGVAQLSSTGALQPEFGWAVIHEPHSIS